ncbi:MAG: peptidoglycan-binding protein [Eggerthellaceae bacterium]|jgi:peptidoglycan hydrolase-like protein with peptidoglycan-binding domain|nr:peptidoglycan-binding protein [Eggerthellaceae bacterium]MDR2715594.1 peptidoglycan-binding protein [Coriobacteriaceae bacterium]
MKTIRKNDQGLAVEDVQQRLAMLGYLQRDQVTSIFDEDTAGAVRAFCAASGLAKGADVTEKVWSALVDASFCLGDRTLYLRMPYFHGNDVLEAQQALAALGFACGPLDGIFGAHTESALRKFQLNLGLPSDGIAGAFTYATLHHLRHSWKGKEKTAIPGVATLGFARAADVLEQHTLCLFGTSEFTRSVASRMSNLALATNPASKILSAESLLVAPDKDMLLVHIVLPGDEVREAVPRVGFEEEATLALRLSTAIKVTAFDPPRVALELPGTVWMDAGAGRSAQHFAIALLDALCAALS